MKENLNKEFTIKTKTWRVIVSSFISALLASLIIYYCFTTYNSLLIKLLQEINTNKEAFQLAELILPIAFVVIMMCKLGALVIADAEEKPTKKTKKKK